MPSKLILLLHVGGTIQHDNLMYLVDSLMSLRFLYELRMCVLLSWMVRLCVGGIYECYEYLIYDKQRCQVIFQMSHKFLLELLLVVLLRTMKQLYVGEHRILPLQSILQVLLKFQLGISMFVLSRVEMMVFVGEIQIFLVIMDR